MATWDQHLWAFFDPSTAVNSEGYLVNADDIFDSGAGSTDYITSDDTSYFRNFIYTGPGDAYKDGFAEFGRSDDVSDFGSLPILGTLFDKIIQSADDQNQSAQTSADRAMEFSKQQQKDYQDWVADQQTDTMNYNAFQADKNRKWQEVQNEKAMNFSADQAALYRDWLTELSNTAHQREMADLREAGLNPKLAGSLGGAFTPSASSPSGVTSSGSVASASTPNGGGYAHGIAANMSMANLAPLANVLSTYITGADAMDRNQNDFAQGVITSLIAFIGRVLVS